jgi:methionyl-tRNA formyltransferase
VTRIAVLAATRRGLRVVQRLGELLPDCELLVVSFREEPHEPPFLDAIRELVQVRRGRFVEARQVGTTRLAELWMSTPIDLLLAVSWRYIVPPRVYRRARRGAFVFHDSLLPAYRGFSPTVWAVLNGDDHTGVSLIEMVDQVDAGDVVDQRRVPIGREETIGEVVERVTEAYLDLLERNLPSLLDGTAPRAPQDATRATYGCKRLPSDNQIDWSAPTERVYNLVRAVSDPYPGAFTELDGQPLRVWSARRLPDAPHYQGRVPGRVVGVYPGQGSLVLTGDGVLLLREVQLVGGERVCASEILTSVSQTLGQAPRDG